MRLDPAIQGIKINQNLGPNLYPDPGRPGAVALYNFAARVLPVVGLEFQIAQGGTRENWAKLGSLVDGREANGGWCRRR